MHILIGLDDSPHSQAALEFVKSMVWPRGTRALALGAVRPMVGAYLEAYVPAPDYAVEVEEDLTRHFKDLTSRAEHELRAAGIEAEARVVRGDAREALIETARAEQSDLIVVGSHGRSGFSKLLIGSVASHVVAHAPCSVLVVKAGTAARGSGRETPKARKPGPTTREEPHSWG